MSSPSAVSLRPPRHRVSRTAIRYWRVRALIGWLVVVVAQLVWLLLADVTVTTASAAGPLSIEGLDRATAERLVDDLTTAAQATRGDAT